MKIQEILKILTNKNLVIDFLGFNDPELIITGILENKKLQEAVQKIPQAFWEDAKKTGIIIFRDYTYKTKNGEQECIDNRYIDTKEGTHTPALVYEKKIPIRTGY